MGDDRAVNDHVQLAWEVRGAQDAPAVVLVHGLGYARWGWG